MWFRRDLRLTDNPALVAATEHGGVVPVFVLDPALLRPSGPARVAFLHRCLRALAGALDGRLVVRNGDPALVVPAVAAEVGATAVFAAEDFAPYGRRRDESVERAGIDLVRVGSSYAVPPGTVVKGDGTPYKVFTPFYRGWREHGWPPPSPVVVPGPGVFVDGPASEPIPEDPDLGVTRLPEAGEPAALDRLERFLADGVTGYAEHRNQPGIDASSRLSPYLKYGCIHPRTVLAGLAGRGGEGVESFRSELGWREFYADVLFERPDSARRHWNRDFDRLHYDTGAEARRRFEAWCRGRTGYPIVDAGMRQLLGEAWMHNRVRMIVASFLVKDLHCPWTWGARHFMAHLVDGDLASNQHGWQWTAGTGTDAAPYHRVFNPVGQGQKFDPDGHYVHRWVPELRGVASSVVHDPAALARLRGRLDVPAGLADYPEPIVDHADERVEALARYQEIRAFREAERA